MTRRVRAATAAATLASVLLVPALAGAQSVDAAASDLRDDEVTFEDGAVTDQDIEDLDRVAAQLQADGGYFKVVVLASPTDQYSSTRAFAERVRSTLGGTGRVMVFDPQDVGIASNVAGEGSRINDAELAAIDAANRSNSFATGVLAAADVLAVQGSGAGGSDGSGEGSGGGSEAAAGTSGGSILPLILMLAFVGLVCFAFYRWWSSRKRKAGQPLSPVSQAEGEQKVRSEVEQASNLVLELADRVEIPDAPKEAVTAFRDGASGFADLQDDLEEADTGEELEAVYPRLVQARWKLQCSKALLDGQAAPPEPTPGPLFPLPPPPAPGADPAPAPAERHYQQHRQHSPWLTDAAIAAITVLASRGLGNAVGRSNRRQASSDDWFKDHYGGGGFGGGFGGSGGGSSSGSRGSSRPRISMGGRRGRGMGRR